MKYPPLTLRDRPLPASELLANLVVVSTDLATLDQDTFDRRSVARIQDTVAQPALARHSHHGVLAHACCCVADVLRLHAPDAPYSADQLTHIFKAFATQFKRLGDADNEYYPQQVYLLKLLAEVRSITLLAELPGADAHIDSMFALMYLLAPRLLPKLAPLAADMLAEIIAEAEHVPAKALQLVLRQLGTPPVVAGLPNAGHAFSIAVCLASPDRMLRQVAQFFAETVAGATEDGEMKPGAAAEKAMATLHTTAVHIWQHVPQLMASAMGLVDNELGAEDAAIRQLATQAIGTMLETEEQARLLTQHPATFSQWVRKHRDVAVAVRTEWVSHAARLVLAGQAALADELGTCLVDTAEAVRAAACQELARGSGHAIAVLPAPLLATLAQLMRERHASVRRACVEALGKAYAASPEAVPLYPSQLLLLVYINDREVTAAADTAWAQYVLPVEHDDQARAERLAGVLQALTPRAWDVWDALVRRQRQTLDAVARFVEAATTDAQEHVELAVAWLARDMPDPVAAAAVLHAVAHAGRSRWTTLLDKAVGDALYGTTVAAVAEVQARDARELGPGAAAALALVLARAAPLYYNRDTVSHLVPRASRVLVHMAKTVPELLANQPVVAEWVALMEPAALECGCHVPGMVLGSAAVAQLEQIALDGAAESARYAARLALRSLRWLLAQVVPVDTELPQLAARLETLAEVCTSHYDAVRAGAEAAADTVMRRVLMGGDVPTPEVLTASIRFLVARAQSDGAALPDTLRLLHTALHAQGELRQDGTTPAASREHLCLEAGLGLLQLGERHARLFTTTVLSRMGALAATSPPFVRRVQQLVGRQTLSDRFLPLVWLAPPTQDTRVWVQALMQRQETPRFEQALLGVLVLAPSVETVVWYLETVATKENTGMLYAIAAEVKVHRVIGGDDAAVHRLAEAAQTGVHALAEARKWAVQTWPGAVRLDREVYGRYEGEAAAAAAARVYLSEGERDAVVAGVLKRGGKARATKPRAARSPRAAKPRATKSPRAARPPRVTKPPRLPTRRSSRAVARVDYADSDSDSD